MLARSYLLLLLVFCFSWNQLAAQTSFYSIPEDSINPGQLVGDTARGDVLNIPALEVSELVTLGEYKLYLEAVKKDSSEAFALSQYPDSSICLDPADYTDYITNPAYDSHPIVGVSWDNAMNYCSWYTVVNSDGTVIEDYYRLPIVSEWLAAYSYLSNEGKENDFNQDYSDWTMNAKDESIYMFSKRHYEYEYYHLESDPPSMKRKISIGSSFLYSYKTLEQSQRFSYYCYNGYRSIGFRMVKKQWLSFELLKFMNLK